MANQVNLLLERVLRLMEQDVSRMEKEKEIRPDDKNALIKYGPVLLQMNREMKNDMIADLTALPMADLLKIERRARKKLKSIEEKKDLATNQPTREIKAPKVRQRRKPKPIIQEIENDDNE